MQSELRVLRARRGNDASALADEVAHALDDAGAWERFFELRMNAGPTVRIARLTTTPLRTRVVVAWGDQVAETDAVDVPTAIQAADALAAVFYDMRHALDLAGRARPVRRMFGPLARGRDAHS